MGAFSIWHWIIVLIIVLLVFGSKKLGNIGADLGSAIKGFKNAVKDGENAADKSQEKPRVIEGKTDEPVERK